MPAPRRRTIPVILEPVHEPAPHFADLSLEVEVGGWEYYVECEVTETRRGIELDRLTYTALIWVDPAGPGQVREVPFVAGGELRREIERAVGEALEV